MDSVKISDRRELGTVNVNRNRMAKLWSKDRKLRTSYVTVDKKKKKGRVEWGDFLFELYYTTYIVGSSVVCFWGISVIQERWRSRIEYLVPIVSLWVDNLYLLLFRIRSSKNQL